MGDADKTLTVDAIGTDKIEVLNYEVENLKISLQTANNAKTRDRLVYENRV